MATLVLSAAGMALGGTIGGTVAGVGMAAVGRFAGATLGRSIDQRLLGGGSDAVETGRVDRFRLTGASEGRAISRIYGRMRVSGQVIWASQFQEHSVTSGGGKGGPSRPKTTQYSYSVSLAIGLCEGVISRVGRVWADGVEIAADDLNLRVYRGTEDQMPDPKMEAIEGVGQVPAYRGTAYVVIEDLDLSRFGNRVPQFSFEVMRPGPDALAEEDLGDLVTGVALVPGTGEYALAVTPVTLDKGFGRKESANVNSPAGKSDYLASVEALEEELPQCGSVSVVVSWFGDDLRCGSCRIKPKVEQGSVDGLEMPWRVGGLTRSTAEEVPYDEGRPVYGGTPTDQSVIEALRDLNARGKRAVFYPFLLMEQQAGNSLPDPWSGGVGQPALPWRGRITTSLAPGLSDTPDGGLAADADVAVFFGTARVSDFAVVDGRVVYSGPEEWSYRRFILHNAFLCQIAGGVDAFCIGSEMRALTQIRGAEGFPAVEALRALAADVRAILGTGVKIGYAADWSEYHGYQPGGTGDKIFHLDPLWADANIDFIGIDNYMPLADWREGQEHLDAGYGSIYNIEYLMENIEGGEGYDWYYHSPEASDAQIRTPITDGQGEPWIWRYKDLRSWWSQPHHDRIDGARSATPTDWVPESKPIWFTEVGCAAVDKGANEPNRFLDLKSSESGLPRASTGVRDDFMQMQYLRAIYRHFGDPTKNPISSETGVRMVDPDRIHVWAWDARPYPAFPGRRDLWSDYVNYARGHWLNGRAASRSLASVVAEICEAAGVMTYDVSALYGVVRGYGVEEVTSARAMLQPLMLAYGFDAIERDGVLVFRSRAARVDAEIAAGTFVQEADQDGPVELTRAEAAEVAGRVRVGFVEADGDYDARVAEAAFPDDRDRSVSGSDLSLVLTGAEGTRIAERWLTEARVARDVARFGLPPSLSGIGAGDVVRLPDEQGDGLYRIDQVEQTDHLALEAVRIEPAVYEPQDAAEVQPSLTPFTAAVPVEALMMDLPLLRGDEDPVAPYFASSAAPWPGSVALYSSSHDADYKLNRLARQPSVIGVTETVLSKAPSGRFDRGPVLRVKLIRGALETVSQDRLLAGANLAVIGDGSVKNWEVFQFAQADLVAPDTYDLSLRLRGQAGSDGIMPEHWPAGSVFVLMDGGPQQIDLPASARGVAQHLRWGPGTRPLGDPAYQYRVEAFQGVGLRPYSVAHLHAVQGSEGIDLSWIRRTRLDGDSWDGPDVPLSEASERYALRQFKDGVLQRETVLEAPSWTYSTAMQAADGPGEVRVDVAQLSDIYGEGPSVGLILPG